MTFFLLHHFRQTQEVGTQQGLVADLPLLGRSVLSAGLLLLVTSAAASEFSDPAVPKVHEVTSAPATESEGFNELTFFAAPKPLSPEAVTANWPRFLGPTDDGKTTETMLLDSFPEEGLTKVWEIEKGTGYTSPVIVDGRLVFFDRIGGEEITDCLDPETGKRFWRHRDEVSYTDRYGFSNGPRASAVISDGKVVTLGVTSRLTCLDLASGQLIWQRDLASEFEIASYFFGHGCCPVITDGKIIVPLGTSDQMSVAAFDLKTGTLVWGTKHEWNAGYASPLIAELQGEPRLLVFAGGESDPATGGLLCINPSTGELLDAFPWRADKYESVNGSTPLAVGDNRVYISDAYAIGGVMLELDGNLKWKEVWRAPDFGMHWVSPLLLDGNLYGFRGRNEPDAWLASYNVDSGKENWREDIQWKIPLESGRDYNMRYFRGNLLHADGRTYALGELGSLGILDLSPEGVKEIDRTQLFIARSTWSPPVIHKGLLYISQHEPDMAGNPPRLICYDFRRSE